MSRFRYSKILGQAGKQEILLQMFRKFSQIVFQQKFSENWRWVPLTLVSYELILPVFHWYRGMFHVVVNSH